MPQCGRVNTVEPPNNNHGRGQPIWPLLRGWPLFGGLYITHLDLSLIFFNNVR